MKYKIINNKLVKYIPIKCIHIVEEELVSDEMNQNEFDTNLQYEHTRSIRMTNWLQESNLTMHEHKYFQRYHIMFCVDIRDSLDATYISSLKHCKICLNIECNVHR